MPADATEADIDFTPEAEAISFTPDPNGGIDFTPAPSENTRKAGYSLIAGAARGIEEAGKGEAVLADPGELPNNLRTHERTLLKAGGNWDYTPMRLLSGDDGNLVQSPEEHAASQLAAQREVQRAQLRAPGTAVAEAAQPYAEGAEAIAEETPGNETLAKAANIAGGMLPLLGVAAIPGVGLPAASAVGGLQATGSTFDQAYAAFKQQGLSDEDARKQAEDTAIKTGIDSAIVYTALPGAGKSAAEKLLAEQLTKASPAIQAAVRTLSTGADGSLVMGANSLITSAQAMRSYNPELSWEAALKDAAEQAAVGFVASAAVHGTIEGAGLLKGKPAEAGTPNEEEQPQETPPAEAEDVGFQTSEHENVLPEANATTRAQMGLLKDGKRNAVLITPGEKMPNYDPAEFDQVKTDAGTFIFDPDKFEAKDIHDAVKNDTIGEVLGYGISRKPNPENIVGAVMVRSKDGTEIQGVLTDKANLESVMAAARRVAGPGDTITLEDTAEALKRRTDAVDAETKKRTNGGFTRWFPRSDGVPDVLDAINEEGGIASPSQSKFADKGDYDGYTDAFGKGMALRLRRSEGGNHPDQLMDILNENHGFSFESTSEMYDAVSKAVESRKALPDLAEQEASQLKNDQAARQEFEQVALKNRGRPEAERIAADAMPARQLEVGDSFTLKGEPFKVSHYDPESDTYTVDDGQVFGRQYLHGQDDFFPDRGSVRGENPDWDVNFTPEDNEVKAMASGEAKAAKVPVSNTGPAKQPLRRRPPTGPQIGIPVKPLPPNGPVRTWLKNLIRPLQNVFAPQSIDAHARMAANMLREYGADMALDLNRADEAMRSYRRDFDRTPVPRNWQYDPAQPLPRNIQFLDDVERNRAALSPEHQQLADTFDDLFTQRINEVKRLAPGAMENLIANYFPHIWREPESMRVREFSSSQASKAPMQGDKSFLRQRSIPYIIEGLKAGLQLASDNPVDMLLAKMHQMDKFIMAQRTFNELEQVGLKKYVPAGQRTPEGWSVPKDQAFQVNGPPVVSVKEAYDAGIRKGLLDFARKMGFPHERTDKLGVNVWGQYQPGTSEIKTRFGGPDFVIAHEIGHGLDEKYGLAKYLTATTDMQRELTKLAEERGRGVPTSAKFKSYIQQTDEKMATVLQAYIHAPELMQRIAPKVKARFEQFISDHPELHDLRDIKPTLALGSSSSDVGLPGFVKLGRYVVPDSAAQVLNNYLSPGLQRWSAFRNLRAASNIMNAAQLGLSAFHLGFTTLDATVSAVAVGLQRLSTLNPHQMFEGAKDLAGVATGVAPVKNYYLGKAVQQAMLKPGSDSFKVLGMKYKMSPAQISQADTLGKMAVTAGLRAEQDPFYQTKFTRNMVRAFHEGGASGYGRTVLNLPMAIVEQSMRPINEFLVPRQKLGVFASMARFAMDQLGPGASHDQVRDALAKAADSTENRMGQMTYDNLFYNKAVKDVALLGFRAYGWQLGKYRESLGAAADTAEQAAKVLQGKRPELTHRMAYVVALPMVVAAMGGITNYLMTGERPKDAADYFFPRTGQLDSAGRPQRLMLPSYLKDLISDWHDAPNLAKMGASFYHKLNPLVGTAVDLLRNRDFYDVEIRHEDDPFWKQQLDNVRYVMKSATPFAVTGAQKLKEDNAHAGSYVLPFFGIVPAKKALTMTPAESKAAEVIQAQMPAGTRTQQQFDHATLVKTLVQDLRTDPIKGRAATQLAAQSGQLKDTDVKNMVTMLQLKPLQYQVHRMDHVEDAMRVWDLANPQERQDIRNILLMKVANSKQLDDDTRARYLHVLTATK